ncbi:SOS response-associated peptidase [Aquimarina brevivitae]|uniref:Abasic site processing protein n=1 Tax=Aquimarina brevivitae TaxID=323412 RepID=A0A4Q7PMF6_9FLAO|nr:SOS response-associated peptidase [Aquimarina brevivitae]RZT00193.1 putative SOS response-associated peptidase YedK [Aquimarina brevivitae]
MCYDVKASLQAQLKRAKHYNNQQAIDQIEQQLVPLTDLPVHHRQGHSHPRLLVYTNEAPEYPVVSQWGLIPFWSKSLEDGKKFWNNTLNARGETIFEKPSFRDAAKYKRCLVYLDGFYEHHHYKGKTYPFYIYRKDQEPMALAGLWSEYVDKETGELLHTFSIVTTTGNELLTKIHNNPKLKEPRMPVILPDQLADQWLLEYQDALGQKALEELLQPYPSEELEAYTVDRLRGKEYMGNQEEITEKVTYEELVF